jgi:hypothetical protein
MKVSLFGAAGSAGGVWWTLALPRPLDEALFRPDFLSTW